jgi:hypothetical protein
MQKLIVSLLFAAAAFSACTASETPVPAGSTLNEGPDKPRFVRLSWNDDPATTAAVVWHTENEVAGPAVEYGASEKLGMRVKAESFEIAGFQGFFHQAKMEGLPPGAMAYYRVGSSSGVSETFAFQTAPAQGAQPGPISFVVQGDSRSESFGVGMGYETLISQMAKEVPAFILDSGDYTMASAPDEWVPWQEVGDPINSSMPRLTTFGNHEMIEKNYFGLMALPEENEERYYSLDYGPIHIVSLDTGFGDIDPSVKDWLAQDLAAASGATWKVVFFHMPPYNSGNHGDSESGRETSYAVREQWVPLFEKYGVDVVAGGHDHNYQNFGFLKGGEPHGDRELPLEGDGSAPLYFISGGAGAPLYNLVEEAEDRHLLLNYEKANNYVLVTVDGKTMTLEVKRLDGTVIETITINK